jgi:hypothetical protein
MNLLNGIPELDGRNYEKWYQKLEIALAMANIDLAINTPQPQEPEKPVRAQNEADATFTARQKKYDEAKKLYDNEMAPWADSNRKCLLIIKGSISESIRMAITACPTAAEYLQKIKRQFTGSSKAYAATLAEQLITKKYTGGGIRDYILEMSHMANKLATMNMPLPEPFLVQLVFKSLPKEFATFHVNYNTFPENWDIEKLIAMCAQEEARLKNANGGGKLVFQVQHQKKKNPQKNYQNYKRPFPPSKNPHESGPSKPPPREKYWSHFPVDKDQCLKCKKRGHYKRQCP